MLDQVRVGRGASLPTRGVDGCGEGNVLTASRVTRSAGRVRAEAPETAVTRCAQWGTGTGSQGFLRSARTEPGARGAQRPVSLDSRSFPC